MPRMPSIGFVLLVAGTLIAACSDTATYGPQPAEINPAHPAEQTATFLSKTFLVDQIFPSMRGPVHTRPVGLVDGDEPELLWLTGYSVDVVEPDGEKPESIEYACHTNLAWQRGKSAPQGFHRPGIRAFTLTQGQTDVRMPPGFGLPVMSDERLTFNTQVLNLDKPDAHLQVRHRAHVRYVRDRDIETPLKPLVATGAFVMASLEDESLVYNVEVPEEVNEDAMCHSGDLPEGVRQVYRDKHRRRFTGHWVVHPGRHEYRTLVTDLMNIPYDTTVHFIGVHVHPYSESLELRDLTTGKTVWKSHHKTLANRPGLAYIDHLSSAEGLPIHADHQYELVSIYHNPTDEPSDGMATMFIYYLDKEFEARELLEAYRAQRASASRDT